MPPKIIAKKPRSGARAKLQEHAYEALRKALQQGQLVPGQSITVREISERIGTSPMPVREAMRRLVAERVLELLPNGSVRVRLMTDRQRAEAREIRSLLEGYAVALAARHITPQELETAHRQNEAMKAAAAAGDPRATNATNRAFHFTLYKAARADVLLELIDGLWVQNAPFIMLYILEILGNETPGSRDVLTNEHDIMLKALADGDGEKAARCMRLDLGQTAITHEETQARFLHLALQQLSSRR